MARKVVISEGEVDRIVKKVDELVIRPISGSANSIWVPEDTVTTKTKSVNKNGTYKASDDDCYGYSKVNVNVPGNRVKGIGDDGNDHVVSEEDGVLNDIVVPSGIQIARPPYRTNYDYGDELSFDGISVVLLKRDGGYFKDDKYPNGVVPFSELEFPIKTATMQEGEKCLYRAWSDLECNWVPPIYVYSGASFSGVGPAPYKKEKFVSAHVDGNAVMLVVNNYLNTNHPSGMPYAYLSVYFAASEPGVVGTVLVDEGYTPEVTIVEAPSPSYNYYTIDGKTVYWGAFGIASTIYEEYECYPETADQEAPNGETLWTAVYGEREQMGDGTQIPVNWTSTYTGDEFTDSFEIEVNYVTGSGGGQF